MVDHFFNFEAGMLVGTIMMLIASAIGGYRESVAKQKVMVVYLPAPTGTPVQWRSSYLARDTSK